MEVLTLLKHYIIPNCVVIILGMILIKKWTIHFVYTFLSAVLLYICLFIMRDNVEYPLYIKILFNTILLCPASFFIYFSLKRQNNLELLKEWKLWVIVAAGLVSAIIIYSFSKNAPVLLYSTLIIAPLYESLMFHEIIFNMIKDKYSLKKELWVFFLLSFIIAIFHASFTVFNMIFITGGFFLLYFLKNRKRDNSFFWIIILIHFCVNLTVTMISIFSH